MLSRSTLLQLSLAGSLVAVLAGLAAYANWYPVPDAEERATGWRRIAWPFPRDAFPPGRAWRRDDTEVYVRPKIGFCGNCDTGVVEDSEVDGKSDIDLLDASFVPVAEGKRIQITDLAGRERLYRIRKDGRERLAQAVAVSYKCDLIVAVVVGKVDDETVAKAARRFLETNTVQVWLNGLLDGK
ncbi:MAG: hypothetical protein E6G95_01465 [Alphaproteobacteria bacterium]|nr:MAG: hypothetical protein E6G95_01465 [Alphaproteobacteria bacterium]